MLHLDFLEGQNCSPSFKKKKKKKLRSQAVAMPVTPEFKNKTPKI